MLITGCSRGLGRALAEEALARGDAVAATARHSGDLEARAKLASFAADVDRSEPVAVAADYAGEQAGTAAAYAAIGDVTHI